jgi:acyl-coenzyme A synthetase/AMP-(fatty) acid ligase
VSLVSGATVNESDLISYCKKNLAPFEVPKKIIFCQELPQTATGKLQKFRLRQEFKDLFLDGKS